MLVRACLGLTELDVAARHGTAVFADWLTIFLDRVLEWFLHPFSPLEEGTDEWAVANHIAFACHRVFMQLSPTIFREVALRKLFNFVSANTAVNALKVKKGLGCVFEKRGRWGGGCQWFAKGGGHAISSPLFSTSFTAVAAARWVDHFLRGAGLPGGDAGAVCAALRRRGGSRGCVWGR